MASAQPVDDSFLDEVDDSFLDETPASRSDAAPAQNVAPPEDEQQTRIRKLLEDSNKTFGMNNEALLAGMVRVPSLGFRQDLGQLGAAAMDKAFGSEIPFADLVKRAKPQVEKYYGDLEAEHPVASGVGTAIGGLPMAAAFNPATATAARLGGGTIARIGAAGLDNAALAGALRFNETGDIGEAGKDAAIAGAMGAGFAAAPALYQGAKTAIGKGAQLPRKGLDGLAKMLGNTDDVAAPLAQAADNVVPMRPEAPPMQPQQQQAAEGMTVRRPRPEQPAVALETPTNAKGGSSDLYDPMGLGTADNVRPSDPELFADVRAKAAAAGKPDFSTAREATAGEEALWGEALNRMRARGLIDNVEDAGKLGTRAATEVLASNPMPAAAPMQPGPTLEAEAAQIASGKDRIRELLGKVGKYTGAAGGFQAGGIMGAIGGAQVGAKSLPRSFDVADKAADKLHALGQKLLTDPAKLMQLEQQGGQMGKAASFIMEGSRNGGEASMAARAYIISSQPWWREQFAEDEQEANQY